MGIRTRLLEGADDRSGYVCEFCGQYYERDRETCLACGFTVVSRRRS